jgi:preprotein translocase subunit SecA
VLEGADLSGEVKDWIREVIERTVSQSQPDELSNEWDLEGLCNAMATVYATDITPEELREDLSEISHETLVQEFLEDALDEYSEREKLWGADVAREVERYIILEVVDTRWREHLENMDYLREGVHLRAFAQKDPLVEYTSEGHAMFEELGLMIHEEVVSLLFHAQIEPHDVEDLQRDDGVNGQPLEYAHESLAGADAIAAAGAGAGAVASERGTGITAGAVGGGATAVATQQQQRVVSDKEKIGRNDPCWCGSGKKFKKCHGA